MTKPQYTHDCPYCQFLQNYNNYDLYVCIRDGEVINYVARFGNDGPDYASCIPSLLDYLKYSMLLKAREIYEQSNSR